MYVTVLRLFCDMSLYEIMLW